MIRIDYAPGAFDLFHIGHLDLLRRAKEKRGDDRRGTKKGEHLERNFAAIGVEVVYFRYTQSTSSSVLRPTLQNIDGVANRAFTADRQPEWARAA